MDSLIVAGIVLVALLLSIMLGKKNKLFADKFLILFLFFALFRQVYIYIEYAGLLQKSYWMLLGKGIYLLQAPFFFLYVFALTRQKNLHLKYYIVLFFPFAAYTFHFLYYYNWVFDYVTLSIDKGLLYINGQISTSWLIFVLLFLLIEPVFLILSYYLLKDYKKRLLQSVSTTDRINLHWLSILFYVWLLSTVVLVPVSILTVSKGWVSTNLMQAMIEVASLIFFFIVGFFGFKQTNIFTNLELKEVAPGKTTTSSYERSGLSQIQAKDYHSRLIALMEEKKPYLNGELTAVELSTLMGISSNHLSQVLNKEQNQNFFDFVNSYRVKEVIRKMEAPENSNLTMLAMALDSGFNSKTSFNTIFKKTTNRTPSQYYKEINTPDSQKRGSNL